MFELINCLFQKIIQCHRTGTPRLVSSWSTFNRKELIKHRNKLEIDSPKKNLGAFLFTDVNSLTVSKLLWHALDIPRLYISCAYNHILSAKCLLHFLVSQLDNVFFCLMFETQSLVTVLKLMQCPDFSGLRFRNERKEKGLRKRGFKTGPGDNCLTMKKSRWDRKLAVMFSLNLNRL